MVNRKRALLEVREKFVVAFGEVKGAKIGDRDPLEGRFQFRGGRLAAVKEVKVDVAVGVAVEGAEAEAEEFDGEAGFFFTFAEGGGGGGFARMAFPAGEFVTAGERCAGRTNADREAVAGPDEADADDDQVVRCRRHR